MHAHALRSLRRSCAILLLAACGEATAPSPPAGSFAMRAVQVQPEGVARLPATLPGAAPGDSTRWVAGAFVLGAEGRWSVRIEQELRPAGGEARTRVLEEAGEWAVRERRGGRLVLELYPGRPMTADRPWTAVLSGDTVHYGAGVFVR